MSLVLVEERSHRGGMVDIRPSTNILTFLSPGTQQRYTPLSPGKLGVPCDLLWTVTWEQKQRRKLWKIPSLLPPMVAETQVEMGLCQPRPMRYCRDPSDKPCET